MKACKDSGGRSNSADHAAAGYMVPVVFAQNSRDEVRLEGGDGSRTGALTSGGEKPGQGVPMVAQPYTLAIRGCGGIGVGAVAHSVRLANTSSNGWGVQEEVTHTLDCTAGPAVSHAMQVRRLTPTECERLQGFPDGYTAIPWRKKPASECPDGPRYKALGNSWAVPNVRWIGERIDDQIIGGLV
jgi:DNA (cytosine-5)-methyltransferase 1